MNYPILTYNEEVLNAYKQRDLSKATKLEIKSSSQIIRKAIDGSYTRQQVAIPKQRQPFMSEGAITDLEDFDEDEMW
jgi:hypothetical protein